MLYETALVQLTAKSFAQNASGLGPLPAALSRRLFVSPSAATCSFGRGLLGLSLVGVAIQSNFKFAEGRCLNLTRVLKSLDPIGFLLFKTVNLGLDLKSLFIFFVNASYQVQSLLLPLQRRLLGT